MHVGGQGNPEFNGCEPVSPSGGYCVATGQCSKQLTVDEIVHLQSQFLTTARLAAEAGFKVIELHLAHGYLLHEFLSPHTNTRSDQYGGSIVNRIRLVSGILNDIRQEVPELVVGARISAEDYLADGLSVQKNRLLLPLLEDAGVSYFSVTAGLYETSAKKHAAMADGEFMRYAREIKSFVHIPVIGVGKILSISDAEQNLLADNCDLVAMGRALVADPDTPKKYISGGVQSICTECDRCRYLRHGLPDLRCPVSGAGQ
jgi:2,4-dienoyl-CoA reductase-like NADH-dependent reductase (Old Yellow Enzyme family)